MAVAHWLLTIIQHGLKNHTEYHHLGCDDVDRLEPEHFQRHLIERLEALDIK